MAYDPNSPLQSHVGLGDIDQIRENCNQLRKHEASAADPANPVGGMLWFDTTNDILKLRNEANTAWLSLYDFANQRIATDTVKSASIQAGTTTAIVSANDTTKGYLNGKLVASSGITLTENNDGGAETLTIAASINTAQIVNAAVTGAKVSKTPSGGSQAILNNNSWVPPAGLYNFAALSATNLRLEINISGTWRRSDANVVGMVFCDGTNMRIYNENTGSTATIYYQTF